MDVAAEMRRKLTEALQPTRLEIVDESELHRGHGGYREGGQTHFRIDIAAPSFEGMNQVARHRAVYAILSDELEAQVHALALTTAAT